MNDTIDNNWKSYYREREFLNHENGFVMIRPKGFTTPVPFNCDNCGCLLRSHEDEYEWNKNGVCKWCSVTWVYKNKSKWESGWRPSKEQVDAQLKNKVNSVININID